MITIPIEDFVFVLCVVVGGGLLLVTVLVDDILGGLLDAVNVSVDIGGVSLMPLMLSFVSMFGVGGLFATQVMDVHGGQAALIGTAFGAGGFAMAYALFSILKRAEGDAPFTLRDLVGRSAIVAVTIPAGHLGSIHVKAEGQTHEFTATAPVEIPSGTIVTITAVAANTLLVAPLSPAAEAAPATMTSEGGSDRA